jgi:hypothetical protein
MTQQEDEQMTLAAKSTGFGAIQSGRISAEEFQKLLVSQGSFSS